ncbi:Abi family protein [[Clostridium] aminophilum]|uniref:Abi family protein n=1 Tax=[Clostridium] aminophilum TaxID=1526 RepID=UPI00331B66A9
MALFEIMTMGDFGQLLSCLTYDVRDDISKQIGFNLACDTNRELVYKYVYTLKDLRNAIAHNAVVFDTRFRNIDPSPAMKQCLMQDVHLPYINFKTIGDYVILMSYYLKKLDVPKTEIKAFIRDFEKLTQTYKNAVNPTVAAIAIHPDLPARMTALKNFL